MEISIIIPCRNEEKFISKCLDSVVASDYPKDKLEVLVIDGVSEDRTREIVEKYAKEYSFIKLLNNPNKFTPFGLNIGIREARGEVIMRMDAHEGYEKDYIPKCLKYLNEHDVDNVGGIIKTLPAKNTLSAKAIAIVLSHPFGAGGSYFRTGSKKIRFVDTVFGGCYKRKVFEKIGLFNEKLIKAQDIEFNRRLKKAGGKILLVPDIIAYYYPKSTIVSFFNHTFINGIWTIYPLKFGIRIFSWRHLIPMLFVLSLIGPAVLSIFSSFFLYLFILIAGLYFFVSIYFSFKIAVREKDVKYLFIMPVVFTTRHMAYGLGSILGLIKILTPSR